MWHVAKKPARSAWQLCQSRRMGIRAAQSPSDAGHREVFAELQTAVTRMEELQSQARVLHFPGMLAATEQ